MTPSLSLTPAQFDALGSVCDEATGSGTALDDLCDAWRLAQHLELWG